MPSKKKSAADTATESVAIRYTGREPRLFEGLGYWAPGAEDRVCPTVVEKALLTGYFQLVKAKEGKSDGQ